MKKGKKLFALFAFVMLGLFAFAFASVTTVYAESKTVTYTVDSISSVTTTGTAPTGSTAAYTQTYTTTVGQATKGNSLTLTLSGWVGKKITGLTLSMKSNTSKGSGSLSVTSGTKTIASIATAAFNTSSWYGSYTTEFVDIAVTLSDSNYTIKEGDDVVIAVAATVNSLYCESYTITYDEGSLVSASSVSLNTNSLEINKGNTAQLTATVLPENATNKNITWTTGNSSIATVDENGLVTAVAGGTTTITATVTNTSITASCSVTVNDVAQVIEDFREVNLQEQLAFHYAYNAECEKVSAPVEGEYYFFGATGNFGTHYATNTISSSNIIASSDASQAESFTFIKNDDYYLIATAARYLGIKSDNGLTSTPIAGATIEDKFLWSFDSTTGAFISKNNSDRFIGFTDNVVLNSIKTYSVSTNLNTGKYPIATLLTTNGGVTVTDKASNTDAVTMRIGYTISKEMYNEILELDSNAEFGLYLNNTHYEACNPVEVDENTYRFYVAVNGITAANYTTVLTACGYVSVNNDIYYTTDVNEYSVKALALEYITNHLDNEQVADAEYALRYLAYYA